MRFENPCPKCNSRAMSRIPGAWIEGRAIHYGPTKFAFIRLSRYVCVRCGYTEEWIDQPEELETVTKHFGWIEFDEEDFSSPSQ